MLKTRRDFLRTAATTAGATASTPGFWSALATSLFGANASAQIAKSIGSWQKRQPGTLWALGYNGWGQLGLNDRVHRSNPVQIAGSWTAVVSTDAPSAHFLKNNGTLWAVGYNNSGELGTNNRTAYSSPVQVLGSWTQVSRGGSSTMGIRSDGTLFSWGYNLQGQLGLGNRTNYSSPTQISGSWVQAAMGSVAGAAIRSDATLWVWGNHALLGNGLDYNSPTQVAASGWAYVACGPQNSYGVKTNGTLWSWGYNVNGALGLGNLISQSSPVQIGVATNWAMKVAPTSYSAHFLKTDGTLWGSGSGISGRMGVGNITSYSAPVQIQGSWIAVAAPVISSGHHTFAIRDNGTLWGWGDAPLLNQGTATKYSSPIQVTSNSWTAVSVASEHGMALRTDATLWVWGNNGESQLGNGYAYTSPAQLPGSWTMISVGGDNGFAMGIKTDGTLWGWGANWCGMIAQSDPNIDYSSPSQVTGSWLQISCGDMYSAGIRSDGTLWSWGDNYSGYIGNGTVYNEYSSPVQVTGGGSWAQVATSYASTVAIRTDGTMWGWGWNGQGNLAQGHTSPNAYSSPVQISGSWIQIKAGVSDNNWFMGIKTDATLWGWGANDDGQLGLGDLVDRSSPTQIAGSWSQVAIGSYCGGGIKTDGTLWMWGGNYSNEIAGLNWVESYVPYQVPGSWTQISIANYDESTVWAKRTDGTTWGWGTNWDGTLFQLTPDDEYPNSPLQIAGSWLRFSGASNCAFGIRSDSTAWVVGEDWSGRTGLGPQIYRQPFSQVSGSWALVSAGYSKSFGIKTDGTLWGWGSNSYGMLGVGVNTDVIASPTQVPGSWVHVASGNQTTVATRTDGTLWGWGYLNGLGYLGLGSWVTSSNSPIQILGATVSSSAVGQYILAVKSDGSLYSWMGSNASGELGFSVNTSSPIQVAGSWSQVAVKSNTVYAIKTNGTLWAWGNGTWGELGNGTARNEVSPIQVAGSWTQVVARSSYGGGGYGFRADGTLWAWGNNGTHGFVDPYTSNGSYSSPIQISGSWLQIAASQSHVVGLRSDNALVVWGGNGYGQAGPAYINTNYYAKLSAPVVIPGFWSAIGTSDAGTYGIKK